MSLWPTSPGAWVGRFQLSTDGHTVYLDAVDKALGWRVDFAQVIKIFGPWRQDDAATRYSPAPCTGIERIVQWGMPDPDHISTSYVERQNLSMRMGMRRFTRLTNAFSKKLENHAHAVALHFLFYNFCRAHTTLTQAHPYRYPTTPAMAAGLADRVWTVEDVCGLLDPERLLR